MFQCESRHAHWRESDVLLAKANKIRKDHGEVSTPISAQLQTHKRYDYIQRTRKPIRFYHWKQYILSPHWVQLKGEINA